MIISKQEVEDCMEKIEAEIEASPAIQRFQRIAEAVGEWRAALAAELSKRGYEAVADVEDDSVLAEIYVAAGPMPDVANIK